MTVIKSKVGNVIDIYGGSKAPGAPLDAWPQNPGGTSNQEWKFVVDPAGSGCYFIKSALDGNVIDIRSDSMNPGAPLNAYPQKTEGYDNQLWSFVPEPSAPGYFYIRSKLSGYCIDILQGSTEAGASLDAWPKNAVPSANQLWTAVGDPFPLPEFESMFWAPRGTGPAPNSQNTDGSDGNQCAFQVSVAIERNGNCTFSGYYQNRGDVWWGTAPAQQYSVGFVVVDTAGKAYSFVDAGSIPSAPQPGSLVTWSTTRNCPVIADNWFAIAAKNWGEPFWSNSYHESFLSVLGTWLGTAASDLGIVAADVETAIEIIEPIVEAAAIILDPATDKTPVRPANATSDPDVPSRAAGSLPASPGDGERMVATVNLADRERVAAISM